ncbi:MAG: hypothetical protein AAB690_00815, partial [Patescibacteria group bacterium]
MILWANLHIYFIFGLFVIGAFLVESLIRRETEKVKTLVIILILSTITACITPFGVKGLLYPFLIFQNYGYLIAENQSIAFLENINFFKPTALWWKITAIIGGLSSLFVLIKRPRNFPIALGIIALAFGILSFSSIRNFSLFGLVMLPFLAYLIPLFFKTLPEKISDLMMAGSITISLILLVVIPIRFSYRMPTNDSWGIGLLPEVNASAEFVKEYKIEGPFFNNYDIGGYLIFHNFPKEKVFVDN